MLEWAPIRYVGFWDVPRIFLAKCGDECYLFDNPFNDEIEDDEIDYQVYLMPAIPEDELPKDWTKLSRLAIRHLGSIPLQDVPFDATRKRDVDLSILSRLAPRAVMPADH